MNELLAIAESAAYEAGHVLRAHYDQIAYELKDDGSPVTLADTASHNILVKHLEQTGIPILSEEGTGIEVPYPERLWIIDPLDGTKDYIKKSDGFSVMIGLLEYGKPVLGVVYAPKLETLYSACAGMGAFVTKAGIKKRMQVSSEPHTPPIFVRSVNNHTEVLDKIETHLEASFISQGSIGIKAGIIGEGQGDICMSFGNLGEWDLCAPHCIADECGLSVTDTYGNPLVYGNSNHRFPHGYLFTHPTLKNKLIEAISEVRA